MLRAARMYMPGSLSVPIIVCVFPAPVAPYAKHVANCDLKRRSIRGAADDS